MDSLFMIAKCNENIFRKAAHHVRDEILENLR